MENPTPWTAYGRPQQTIQLRDAINAHSQSRGEDSLLGPLTDDASKPYYSHDSSNYCKPSTRMERTQHVLQTVGMDQKKHRDVIWHTRTFQGRAPVLHVIQDRLERNPVYNEPFGVLDHFVLSGARDRDIIQRDAEKSAKQVPKHVPPHMKSRFGLSHSGGKKYTNQFQFLAKTDPKHFFRLQSQASQDAVRRLQNWWRGLLARRTASRLKELFTITRYDPRTGMWYKANTKTGKSEWIY